MGYYIETPESTGKAEQLVLLHEAEQLSDVMAFAEVPDGKALICVVENGAFDAAALCYSEAEHVAFNDVMDARPRSWLLMDKATAHQLASYPY